MNELLQLLMAVETAKHVFEGAGEVTFSAVPPFLVWFNALGTITSLVASVIGLFKIQEIHIIMNSRLTELLKSTSAASYAQGLAEGRKENE